MFKFVVVIRVDTSREYAAPGLEDPNAEAERRRLGRQGPHFCKSWRRAWGTGLVVNCQTSNFFVWVLMNLSPTVHCTDIHDVYYSTAVVRVYIYKILMALVS